MSLVTEPEKTRAAAPMSIDPATPARTLGVTDHQLVRGTRTPMPSEPETLSDPPGRPQLTGGPRPPRRSEPETLSAPPVRTQLTGRSSSTAVSVPSKFMRYEKVP